MQCCGTVMICSDVGKVLVPVPESDNMKHSFPTSKNSYKFLPFECQNQHFFPESLLIFFDFVTFWSRSKSGSGTGSGTRIIMHSGSAKAKSYGYYGSGSTTMEPWKLKISWEPPMGTFLTGLRKLSRVSSWGGGGRWGSTEHQIRTLSYTILVFTPATSTPSKKKTPRWQGQDIPAAPTPFQ